MSFIPRFSEVLRGGRFRENRFQRFPAKKAVETAPLFWNVGITSLKRGVNDILAV